MKIKLLTFISFLFFILSFASQELKSAQSNLPLAQQASQAYFAHDFANAESLYKKMEEYGVSSGDLYYNLGNILYRQGKVGEAIQYYEKALKIIPRDRDLYANYRYVKASLVDQLNVSTSDKMISYLFFWNGYLTLDQSLVMTFCLFLVFQLFLISKLYYSAHFQKVALIVLFFINCLTLPSFVVKYIHALYPEAILLSASEKAFSEPMAQSVQLFEIHQGCKVSILDEQQGYYKVELLDGRKAWMKKESFGEI